MTYRPAPWWSALRPLQPKPSTSTSPPVPAAFPHTLSSQRIRNPASLPRYMDADAFTPALGIGEIVPEARMLPRAGRVPAGPVPAPWARFLPAAAAVLLLAAAGTLLGAETIVRRDASGRVLETITIQNDGSRVVRDAKGGVIRRESKPREGRAEVRDERGRVTERRQTEPDGDLMIRDGKGGVVGTQKVQGERIEFRDAHGGLVWTAVQAPDRSRVYRDAKGRVMAKESSPRP